MDVSFGIFLIFMFSIFISPSLIAWKRAHSQLKLIIATNILAGWTGVLWFAALIWAFYDPEEDKREIELQEKSMSKKVVDSPAAEVNNIRSESGLENTDSGGDGCASMILDESHDVTKVRKRISQFGFDFGDDIFSSNSKVDRICRAAYQGLLAEFSDISEFEKVAMFGLFIKIFEISVEIVKNADGFADSKEDVVRVRALAILLSAISIRDFDAHTVHSIGDEFKYFPIALFHMSQTLTELADQEYGIDSRTDGSDETEILLFMIIATENKVVERYFSGVSGLGNKVKSARSQQGMIDKMKESGGFELLIGKVANLPPGRVKSIFRDVRRVSNRWVMLIEEMHDHL